VCLVWCGCREEVEKGDLIIATYKSQEGRILTVTVTDHVGQQIYQKTVKGGKYTVTASANGAQRTCFFNTEAMPTVVDFDIKRGLEAKDYGNIADKNSLKPLELELLRLEDIIKYIQTEFQRMEANEQEQTNINNSTNSMVFWFSIFSMVYVFVCARMSPTRTCQYRNTLACACFVVPL